MELFSEQINSQPLFLLLLVVSDSANYNKGEHGLHTVFSSVSLAWGCSHTPTQTPIIHTTHTHVHHEVQTEWPAIECYSMQFWIYTKWDYGWRRLVAFGKTCRTTHGHTMTLLLSLVISQFFQCISKQCVTQNQETNMHHHFDALTHHLRTIVRQQWTFRPSVALPPIPTVTVHPAFLKLL